MVFEPGQTRTLKLLGEVVEIYEQEGKRRTRIAVRPQPLVDIAAGEIRDAHLGDPVWIEAQVTIRSVQPALAGGVARDREQAESTGRTT